MTDTEIVFDSAKPTARLGVVRDAAWYTAATYTSQVLAFIIGIAAKRFLGPTGLGVWTLLFTLLSYLGILGFGVLQATNKEMAYALGKKDELLAEILKGVQFTFVTLTGLLGTIGVLAYVLINFNSLSAEFAFGLVVIALIFPLNQIQFGQVTVYWANKRFPITSLTAILETVLMGTIGLLLIWHYGVYGQIVVFALVVVAKFGFLWWQAQKTLLLKVRFAWNRGAFCRLLSVGFPLQIINLFDLMKLSLASLLVAYYLDITAVGYYALALSIQNYIYWTPNAFSIVMFPRFQERFASFNDDATALLSYLVKPLMGLGFFVLPILISGSYFVVPALIRQALADYKPSIPILPVLLAGTFFLSMEHMPGQLLTTANKLWQRVLLGLISTSVLVVCVGVVIINGPTLLNIVGAVALANLLGFFVNFLYAYAIAGGPRSDRWLWVKLLAAFAYLMVVLLVMDRVLPTWTDSLLRDFGSAFIKWGITLIVLLPLFVVAERNLSLLATFRSLLGARFGGAHRGV